MTVTSKYIFTFLILFTAFAVTAQHKVIIGTPTDSAGVEKVALFGFIRSGVDRLPNATVLIQGTKIGAVANQYGRYRLNLAPGTYPLLFQFIGMKPQVVEVTIYRTGTMDVVLAPDDINLDLITIEADPDRNIRSVMTGVNRLEMEDISRIPTFLGEVDVIKSLQTIPGVSSVGEGSGGFNVRGGKADQNLILFNNGQIFNASHILGFFSAFNPGVIDNFTLYKGYIPARYGGRVSSVLDVNMREGNTEKLKTEGSVGIVSSRIVVNGPLWQGANFIAGARSSYSDWILSTVKDPNIRGSNAYFNDFSLGFSQRFGGKHKLSLKGYRSSDYFRFADDFSFDWTNDSYNLTYDFYPGETITSTTYVGYGRYKSGQSDPEGADAARRQIGLDFLQTRQELKWSTNEELIIRGGIEWNLYNTLPETIRPEGNQSGTIPSTIDRERASELGVYIENEIPINDKLKLAASIRYSLFNALGPFDEYIYLNNEPNDPVNIIDTINFSSGSKIADYRNIEPRISLRYQFDSDQSLKLSYVRLNQYIHNVSNTIAPTPTDLWQMSNRYIRPLSSDNYSVGYFRNFKSNSYELSFDVFYREQSNLLDFRDFAQLVGNPSIETELLSGIGRSYGSEFLLKKKEGKWNGWVAYTYSRSLIQINGDTPENTVNSGDWYPSNFDKPHNFVIVSKVNMGRNSSFDANFTYITGRPLTAIETNYNLGAFGVPDFSERNTYRIPDYIRLDIGFTVADNIWKKKKPNYMNRKVKQFTTFSFYNVLARKNAYSVYFIRPGGRRVPPKAHKFSVLGNVIPAISYNFKF